MTRKVSRSKQKEIIQLFTSVFTSSEGEKEGESLGKLTSGLAEKIDDEKIICLGEFERESLVGSVFFTRLKVSEPVRLYLLGPLAVSVDHQERGVGRALIDFGLNDLKKRKTHAVVTYGDPAFYSKSGFELLSEDVIQAPLKLSMPFGWQGQSLMEGRIPAIRERPGCVKEFDDPIYW